MTGEFQVSGRNAAALFTLKLHRGDGMTLVAMNWKDGKPPRDFVGFAIEYKEPGGHKFFALKNRLGFPGEGGEVNPNRLSTRLSPVPADRWSQRYGRTWSSTSAMTFPECGCIPTRPPSNRHGK